VSFFNSKRVKVILGVFAVLLSVVFIVALLGDFKQTGNGKNETETGLTSHNSIENQKLPKIYNNFNNALPDNADKNVPSVTFSENVDFWIIDGKTYSLQSSENTDGFTFISWEIDLAALTLCGIGGATEFYSSDGKIDNEIIVAKKCDKYYVLVFGDAFSPYSYNIDDFVITNKSDDNVESYLGQVWSDHLSREYNLSFLLVEDEKSFEFVELKPKANPELTYRIDYVEYKGNYFSSLPYGESTSMYRNENGSLVEVTKRDQSGAVLNKNRQSQKTVH